MTTPEDVYIIEDSARKSASDASGCSAGGCAGGCLDGCMGCFAGFGIILMIIGFAATGLLFLFIFFLFFAGSCST